MKSIMKLALISAMVMGLSAPESFASTPKQTPKDAVCQVGETVAPLIIIGALVGAVTGGVGAAVIWSSAYAVGGAAVGGAAGVLLGHHTQTKC